MTAIKMCGITRAEDAAALARAGAQAAGFIFYAKSPRCVSADTVRTLQHALPPFITTVGLFVDAEPDAVRRVLATVRLDMLQFHGDETPAYCRQFAVPYLKAARVRPGLDLLQYARDFHDAKGLLLDAYVEGTHGGTGATFDWALIPKDLPLPVVLSGGLTPDNVGAAIRAVRPWAVDVCSGVASGKGIKDAAKIAAFVTGVRNADV